jgi:UDP-N-acetylmuramoyl-tripeptide--D-alanyl-D-alanine ligase
MAEALVRRWRTVARALGRRSLELRPVPVVAVTGSVGKSTTTAFVAQLLRSQMKVETTEDNMNLGWAIPSTLLGRRYTRSLGPFLRQLPLLFWRGLVRPHPVDAFVLEVATNYPGDIPASLTVFRPSVAVYTTITNAHIGNFANAAALFEEKAAIIRALPHSGLAVLRYDDERVRSLAACHEGQTLFYGFDPRSDVRMSEPFLDEHGQHVVLSDADGPVPLVLPHVRQRHHLYAVMAAWAVGRGMGLPRASMAEQVRSFSPLAGRGRTVDGINDTLVVDDCHNASPAAAVAAIQSLALLGAGRRKVVVLGDMKELGAETEVAHYEVGREAAHIADLLVAVGECGETVSAGFSSASDAPVRRYADVAACVDGIEHWLRSGDAILVKGSHSMNLGRLVRRLERRM